MFPPKKFVIRPDGSVTCLYQEQIDLSRLGRLRDIRRASDVEPDARGRWWARIRAVRGCPPGPTLGPFGTRSEALAAEAAYLQSRM